MNQVHVSESNDGEWILQRELHTRKKILRTENRRNFLIDCLAEQVLPPTAPRQLISGIHPFPDSARAYLEEAISELKYRLSELQAEIRGVHLPHNLILEIQHEDRVQKEHLKKKLERICRKSRWRTAGRPDLIINISDKILSTTEIEALSLGLKYDTGITRRGLAEYIALNQRTSDDDIDRGFIQGVTACCLADAASRKASLPRRYASALKKLGKDEDIIITKADKGGGTVIMNIVDYKHKMNDLLNDSSVYRKVAKGTGAEEAKHFQQKARRILQSSTRGKGLLYLLEENPRNPSMRGLPKMHKPDIPMRPITSGIGSAPHRLAKLLARPISSSMGKLSSSHLNNSSDLINRLKSIAFRNKKLASFDVKSLFTNVPTDGAIQAMERAIENIDDGTLPLPKRSFVALVRLCVGFGNFEFMDDEYEQVSGLAMGSPLSAVLACLFMEMLEVDNYRHIVGNHATWLRYVDDVLVVVPRRTDLQDVMQRLNCIHTKIQFTLEEEENGRLPFLDAEIHRTDDGPRFSVYRKPTGKDDYIHFFSGHNKKTKSGVVIGFFLRALRICSPEFLEDEVKTIISTFMDHKYPKGLLLDLKNKAISIHNRPTQHNTDNTRTKNLILPNSRTTENIRKYLGISTAITSGTKISDIIQRKEPSKANEKSIVYSIPCNSCEKSYIGETARGLQRRITEHKADVRHHRICNAMVVHIDENQHLPNWSAARVLEKNLSRIERKIIESAYISSTNNLNTASGFFKLSKVAASKVIQERSQVR